VALRTAPIAIVNGDPRGLSNNRGHMKHSQCERRITANLRYLQRFLFREPLREQLPRDLLGNDDRSVSVGNGSQVEVPPVPFADKKPSIPAVTGNRDVDDRALACFDAAVRMRESAHNVSRTGLRKGVSIYP